MTGQTKTETEVKLRKGDTKTAGNVLPLAGLIGGVGLFLVLFSIFSAVSGAMDPWLWELILQSRPTNDVFDPQRLLVTWTALGFWGSCVALYLIVRRRGWHSAPPIEGTAFFALVASTLVMVLYVTFHLSWIAYPEWVWREDGFFEYLTVAILFFASICMFAAARHFGDQNGRWARYMLLAAGVVLFLAGMEEMSWGQRILGIETPEALKAVNAQDEINVHNLFVGYNEIFRMLLALAISSAFLVCAQSPAWLKKFGLTAVLPDQRYVYFPIVLIPAHIYDEMFEQVLSFLILYYAINIAARAFGLRRKGSVQLRDASSFPAE